MSNEIPIHHCTCFLWDIDGTLIDTTSLIVAALDHTYRKFIGKTMPAEEIRAIIGTPLCTQVLALGDPADFGTSAEEMEVEFIRYYEANRQQESVLYEVIEILKRGKLSGRQTALITSKNHKELANTLPRLGINDFIEFAITADDVAQPKPSPEGILQALKRLEISPSDAVYIGDTVHDMQAAKGAGVANVGVLWGAATRAQLEAQGPTAICSSASELAKLLSV